MLGHANVRKTCSINSGHHFVPTLALSIRRQQRAPCTLLRAAWLQLTLRRSSSSSVLTSKRADVLVELAGRRRRNPSEKLMLRARQALEDTIAIERRARNYFPLDPTPWLLLLLM